MKYWTLVVVTVLLITSCLTQEKGKAKGKGSKKKKNSLVRYITNWGSYQLPAPVTVITLKDVLEKIALYKQNLYCPFGENECAPEKYGLKDIIMQIVRDSVAELENNKTEDLDDNGTLTSVPKVNKEEKGKYRKEKDSVRTQHFIIPFSGLDFSDLMIITKILQFGSLIYNKSLSSEDPRISI